MVLRNGQADVIHAVVTADIVHLLLGHTDGRHIGDMDNIAGGQRNRDGFQAFIGVVADAALKRQGYVAAIDFPRGRCEVGRGNGAGDIGH